MNWGVRMPLVTLCFLIGFGAARAQPQDAEPNVRPTGHRTEVGKLINTWWEARRAAGNVGDRYDNRDRGHSELRIGTFHPQMRKVTYTDEEKKQRRDWAIQTRLLPFVTLGNSSTSAPPERGGSNPRQYYVRPEGLKFLYAQYRVSNIYVYPEHRDHDPGRNKRPGYGDLYPTNTPFLVISQGSSGSDRAFLRALAYTMAAFRPEVKKNLVQKGLLAPTLQYLLRRCYQTVSTDEDYLTGKAHPTVFAGSKLDAMQMVQRAQNMSLDTVPPLVQLEVLEEDFTDAADGQPTEKLADTPVVVARVHRAADYQRRILVSARKSQDPEGKDLTYRWVVLRGDPELVQMRLSEGDAVAELNIAYHGRVPADTDPPIESNRVDIGVFVHNGSTWSAPGFVTVFYPDNELRTYDDRGRPVDIYRQAGDTRIGYPSTASSDLISERYDIFNWPAFFAAVLETSSSLGARLLKQQLDSDQLETVARAAEAFEAADLELPSAKEKLSKEERQAQTRLRNQLAKILTTADPATGKSVKEVLERALNAIRMDHTLCLRHAEEIDALAKSCSDTKGLAAFEAARKKLNAIGIVDGDQLKSAIPGRSSLTAYEAYQVERLNLAIMNHLLFPGFLKRPVKVNYVDSRLSTPQPWRDVYRCDEQGNVLGWDRYEDGKPGQYVRIQNTDP